MNVGFRSITEVKINIQIIILLTAYDILNKFKPYIDETYRFILTARSYINESVNYKLNSVLNIQEKNKIEIDINTL